jgi:hypothetical protein
LPSIVAREAGAFSSIRWFSNKAFSSILISAKLGSNVPPKTRNVMETSKLPKAGYKLRRDIFERRAYAAQRAAIAVERVSRVAAAGLPDEKARARRWMHLRIIFAASRHK